MEEEDEEEGIGRACIEQERHRFLQVLNPNLWSQRCRQDHHHRMLEAFLHR